MAIEEDVRTIDSDQFAKLLKYEPCICFAASLPDVSDAPGRRGKQQKSATQAFDTSREDLGHCADLRIAHRIRATPKIEKNTKRWRTTPGVLQPAILILKNLHIA